MAKDGVSLPEPNVSVVIVSRSPALAEGLRAFLRGSLVTASVCHTAHQALNLARDRVPRLMIVEWQLADASGLELALELSRGGRSVPLLFCIEPGPFRASHESQAAAVGALGCFLVTATREAVLHAVAEALDMPFGTPDPGSVGELVERTAPRTVLLTAQERVVLRLMRQQLTYKEIAIELGVSWHTVRSHAQSVLRKLGIHSRRDLGTWDTRLGAANEVREAVTLA